MTLCTAGISSRDGKNRIIVVCDQKVTFFGGHFSADGMALKVTMVHANWSVMFAGDNSTLVPLVDAVQVTARKSKRNTLRQFARLCSRVYREERKKIIETDILSKYDISTYQEYVDLKKTDVDLYGAITKEIERMEEDWHLLFFGFDKEGKPHVFVITEYGKIQFCDIEGFAAIGSGAWAAIMGLALVGYRHVQSFEESLYRLLVAKFIAEESADGVGEATLVAVLEGEHSATTALLMSAQDVKALREEWKQRPRIPDGVGAKIKGLLYNPKIRREKMLKQYAATKDQKSPG